MSRARRECAWTATRPRRARSATPRRCFLRDALSEHDALHVASIASLRLRPQNTTRDQTRVGEWLPDAQPIYLASIKRWRIRRLYRRGRVRANVPVSCRCQTNRNACQTRARGATCREAARDALRPCACTDIHSRTRSILEQCGAMQKAEAYLRDTEVLSKFDGIVQKHVEK